MKKPIGFLKDEAGDWSSKRLFGLMCFLAAAGLAFAGKSAEVCGVFLGAASLVFGVQALTKT